MNSPHEGLAAYVLEFLSNGERSWIRRRVETVQFLDVDTVSRRTTLDVGMAQVRTFEGSAPFFERRPIVPLAVLSKELLVNFSIWDAADNRLTVVPSDVDSFLVWSALMNLANNALGCDVHQQHEAVSTHIREVVQNFPAEGDSRDDPIVGSWTPKVAFSASDAAAWNRLLSNEPFVRNFRDFTFSFLMCTQLVAADHPRVIKFEYHQFFPFQPDVAERTGWSATELQVEAPSVGWVRSYHLRVQAPPGTLFTDAGLFRVVEAHAARESRPATTYQRRLTAEWAQIHTAKTVRPADHVMAIRLRPPLAGFLRAAALVSWFTAGVLIAGRCLMDRTVDSISSRADAAVAILVFGPTLLSAYLVRPDEHAVASRLLRPIRYAVAGSGLIAFVAAASLVLNFDGHGLLNAWTGFAVVASVIAAWISVVAYRTGDDLNRDGDVSATFTDEVVEVSDED